MIPILPTTASQDYTAKLFADLDALDAHPAIVQSRRALDEQARRLQAITDAAIAFARPA